MGIFYMVYLGVDFIQILIGDVSDGSNHADYDNHAQNKLLLKFEDHMPITKSIYIKPVHLYHEWQKVQGGNRKLYTRQKKHKG